MNRETLFNAHPQPTLSLSLAHHIITYYSRAREIREHNKFLVLLSASRYYLVHYNGYAGTQAIRCDPLNFCPEYSLLPFFSASSFFNCVLCGKCILFVSSLLLFYAFTKLLPEYSSNVYVGISTKFPHFAETMQLDLQGPVFSQEPPHKIEFSNSTGGHIECSGHGSPQPEVQWNKKYYWLLDYFFSRISNCMNLWSWILNMPKSYIFKIEQQEDYENYKQRNYFPHSRRLNGLRFRRINRWSIHYQTVA